ncbi:substrate-binding periplasmic protein [Pseudaeromonas paramecii]|uniref:Transporter substrate-binding domain-containing protein n=1 Tax=Pseudaeromonas paramecii TaxID=2138166 RepID=A0ABP8PVK3_9GAMM
MKQIILVLACLVSCAARALPPLDYLTEDAYPYNYPQANGEPGGLAVSLLHLTWQALGQRPTPIRLVPWPRGYYLLTQKPDVVLFSTTRTPNREPLFQWVCPIATLRVVLVGRREDGGRLASLDEARTARIGAQRSDVGEQMLLNHSFDDRLLMPANSYQQLARQLQSGRVRYIAGTDTILAKAFADLGAEPGAFVIKWVIDELPLCYAFNANQDPAVVAEFARGFAQVLASPAYDQLRRTFEADQLRYPALLFP